MNTACGKQVLIEEPIEITDADTAVKITEPEELTASLEDALRWPGKNRKEIKAIQGQSGSSAEITGEFYGAPANGSAYFSVYNGDVVKEVILYVQEDDFSFSGCSAKMKELYGEPETGEEPYVEVNGGVRTWERFDDGDVVITLSKGGKHSFYSVSSRMKNEEQLDVTKMTAEGFEEETGYAVTPDQRFSEFRIERKEKEEGAEKKYRITFRLDGKFYIVDVRTGAEGFELFPGREPIVTEESFKIYDDGVYKYLVWNDGNNVWDVQAGNVKEDDLISVMKAVQSLYGKE